MNGPLRIDVVSDVVCPWCFIGKRHLDVALAGWRQNHPEVPVAITWQPYFLNPDTPEHGEPYRPFLERKFGGALAVDELQARVAAAGRRAGVEFAFDKIALRANTLRAHRLLHHAQALAAGVGPGRGLVSHPEKVSPGVGLASHQEKVSPGGGLASHQEKVSPGSGLASRQGKVSPGGTAIDIDALVEALFAAHFMHGEHVGNIEVLVRAASAAGLEANVVRAYLDSDADADTVRAAADRARQIGVSGVPCFIFDGRFASVGAQPPETLRQGMEQALSTE